METNTKIRILQSIGKVYDEAKNSKLTDAMFENIDNELNELSEYFSVSKMQAFFLSQVFALNYKGDSVDINDLVEYFDCNPMKVLEYSNDIEVLHSKGIFIKKKSKHRLKIAMVNDQFIVNEKITVAIFNNLPMPELKNEVFDNVVDVLEYIYKIGQKREEEEISTRKLFNQLRAIIESNQHFSLIKKVHQMSLEISDKYLFLYLIWKTVTGIEKVDIGLAIDGILDKPSEKVAYLQTISTSENDLIKQNLIEIVSARFFNDTEMKLTDNSITLLQEEGIKLFTNKKKDNIIEPSKINYKELFFNSEEKNQLELLKNLLIDIKFKEIQTRLQLKNLPKGIAVLFYGSPGTGKTESVYQIAKETEREIIRVDISESKSMWFGESEKKIKRIFTEYKDYSKQCDLIPILLFNEADAILATRKENTNSSVDQTENTIQNIILEELENFEGIFFATTNLVNNLDTAFERRFLFKIEFHKPEISVKAKIWKSKLQNLNTDETELLASRFDFSGGQIDNVVRKTEMYEIINGNIVNVQNIIDFCNEEQLSKSNRVKIGFTKN
ncbi:MAG: ATP-binding protein [Bacteroidales bacterium]